MNRATCGCIKSTQLCSFCVPEGYDYEGDVFSYEWMKWMGGEIVSIQVIALILVLQDGKSRPMNW